jgi:hypothetical protein
MTHLPTSSFEGVQRLACLLDGRQTWDTVSPNDWSNLLQLAIYHRVVPLFCRSIEPHLRDEQPFYDKRGHTGHLVKRCGARFHCL